MNRFLLTGAGVLALAASAAAEVKVGVILSFTGPIESLTPDMAASAELAFKEASEALMSGRRLKMSDGIPGGTGAICLK